jgi:hypothetical protein
MIQLVRPRSSSTRAVWAGVPGVRLLELDEHLDVESKSLARFPRRSDGSIEWTSVDPALVLRADDEDAADLISVVEDFGSNGATLVVRPESLVMPSFEMTSEAMAAHIQQIVDSIPEFWIYRAANQTLMERSFAGLVTIARLPARPIDLS